MSSVETCRGASRARPGSGASRVGRVPDLARPGSGAEASGEGRRAAARLYGEGAVGGGVEVVGSLRFAGGSLRGRVGCLRECVGSLGEYVGGLREPVGSLGEPVEGAGRRSAARGRRGALFFHGGAGIVTASPTRPAMPNTRQLQFLARVRKAFVNARDETAVQDLMGPLGYDKDELAEGLALVDAAEREAREADTERAESRAATRTAGQARAKVAQTHARLTKLARSVFDEGSVGWETLRLSGRRPDGAAAEVLAEARRFHEALLADAALLAALAVRRVTTADAERGLADVDAAVASGAVQTAEAGEAQVATAERDTAVEAVAGYWEDFSDVVEVALEDAPQLRETLGMQEAGS